MCPLYCRQKTSVSENADPSLVDETAVTCNLLDNTSAATYVRGTQNRERILLQLQQHCTRNTQNKLLVAAQMLL